MQLIHLTNFFVLRAADPYREKLNRFDKAWSTTKLALEQEKVVILPSTHQYTYISQQGSSCIDYIVLADSGTGNLIIESCEVTGGKKHLLLLARLNYDIRTNSNIRHIPSITLHHRPQRLIFSRSSKHPELNVAISLRMERYFKFFPFPSIDQHYLALVQSLSYKAEGKSVKVRDRSWRYFLKISEAIKLSSHEADLKDSYSQWSSNPNSPMLRYRFLSLQAEWFNVKRLAKRTALENIMKI